MSAKNFFELMTSGRPLIDVRAPVEFAQGSLPGAINAPIMNDEERADVGTTYKKSGREVALTRGHELVSGATKTLRIENWKKILAAEPRSVLYCFRGGLRSQITQQWLREAGIQAPLIRGGYKAVRQFLINAIDDFAKTGRVVLLTGPTGSAKTHWIQRARTDGPAIDLEGLARHRGSAFGAHAIAQPPQIDFENALAAEILRLKDSGVILLEDESRLIGKNVLPASFFELMRASPVLVIDEPLPARVQNIFGDYILESDIAGEDPLRIAAKYEAYRASTCAISRRLGGARSAEILADIDTAEQEQRAGRGLEANKVWIEKLLVYYYDPMYSGSFDRRAPKVLARGKGAEILDKLKIFRAGC